MLRAPGNQALRKGRVSIPGQIYLVTTVTTERSKLFADFRTARIIIGEMRASVDRDELESLAWVLMPDHLHWLLALNGQFTLPKAVQSFKSRSAIRTNQHLNSEGPVWQSAYHDRALRKDEDLRTAARYLVANPLRAGLVENIGDYPHWDACWL